MSRFIERDTETSRVLKFRIRVPVRSEDGVLVSHKKAEAVIFTVNHSHNPRLNLPEPVTDPVLRKIKKKQLKKIMPS